MMRGWRPTNAIVKVSPALTVSRPINSTIGLRKRGRPLTRTVEGLRRGPNLWILRVVGALDERHVRFVGQPPGDLDSLKGRRRPR